MKQPIGTAAWCWSLFWLWFLFALPLSRGWISNPHRFAAESTTRFYAKKPKPSYSLGLGKNKPFQGKTTTPKDDNNPSELEKKDSEPNDTIQNESEETAAKHWIAPNPVKKPKSPTKKVKYATNSPVQSKNSTQTVRRRKMVARDNQSQQLRNALWHEEHYVQPADGTTATPTTTTTALSSSTTTTVSASPLSRRIDPCELPRPALLYPDIDLSIPESVYSETTDAVWELLRWEACAEAQREPLLVSFLYSTILNHPSLESSLAFLLANRLSSPAMISTQVQSLILQALESDFDTRRSVRADIMAVRDRDPACTCLPDVFLYFKGFHALQTQRVAHCMYRNHRQVLAHYLQSQVSQVFQIDIHPNATLGMGIMLDHGTGIVIGETARVGHNCSILHHVTLGGSGKKGVDRHPKVGDGVLLGAGCTVLGNVTVGAGSQVGAGTLVIGNLPPHCVAVGVPARIIGSFVDVTEQPSIGMNQMMMDASRISFESDGI